ncbi:hypothetical protein CLCR_04659 [Cladophialophora carrionii]|uniref:Uncharacterized protein n=1 Tax=Cladophialophora carrionii TaxID=86049 RepID=A0A1C1CKP7_9EURO|nr:hypothetical protein CLCR_04659 [Cladophialophora carrionii]
MARADQEGKPAFLMEARPEDGSLLNLSSDRGTSPSQGPKYTRRARQLSSLSALGESILDLFVAIICAYFIVFAALVYSRRDEPLDRSGNQELLDAAKYNPTIFPILFAGVIGKFLKAVAAIKLENGTSVLSLEYLLQSRTVLSTVTAPLILKTVNLLTPLLFVLWALSPLGGQAGLRAISTKDAYTNTTNNFTYLAYVSPFTNAGVNSASAEPLVPINAIFTSALIGSAKAKSLAQDQYGNVKVPLYESLPSATSDSARGWRSVPDNGDYQWSSLTGLPIHGLPSAGVSTFNLETGYMVTTCNVSGHDWSDGYRQSLMNQSLWSGANYAFTMGTGSPFTQYNFSFLSLDLLDSGSTVPTDKILTIANCTVTMRYVEVQIKCNGQTCESVAVRPSNNPANHTEGPGVTSLDEAHYTPINGLGQQGTMYMSFLADLTNATNPTVGCDTTFCPPSVVEAYLADPANTVLQTATTKLWKLGDELISQRFTQLFNTYWIDSIAPAPVSGNFSLEFSELGTTQQYNTDSTLGTITTSQRVIKCDYKWLAILLVCSLVLFVIGLATVVLTALRRGPDVLDRFSPLLRYSRFANIPHKSSMEDATEQSRRLRNLTVRLGDIRPEDDVGYIAIAVLDGTHPVQKLSKRRTYA